MNNFYFGQSYEKADNNISTSATLRSIFMGTFPRKFFLKIEYFGRLFYVFIFLCSIFSLIPNIINKKSYYVLIIFILLISFLSYDFYLFGGYQEYLLFSLILFARNFLYNLSKRNEINFNEIILYFLILTSYYGANKRHI